MSAQQGAGRVDLGTRVVTCSSHGPFKSTGMSVFRRELWTTCPSCDEEARREALAKAERERSQAAAQRAAAALQRADLPARFVGRTFDDYVVEADGQAKALAIAKAYAASFEDHLRAGTGLVFAGGPGTGKSHLACAVLQSILPRRVGVYTTVMGLVRAVRDTWRRDSDRTESQVLGDIGAIDLLVIDEMGVQYGTDGEKTILFEVLDRRYQDRRPTIILTNLKAAALQELVGDRTYDRLTETARWVPFGWPSYRAKAARAAA